MKNNYAQQLAWFEKEERPNLVKEIQKPSNHAVPRYASSKPAPVIKRTLSKNLDTPSLHTEGDTSTDVREPLDSIENRTPRQPLATTGMCFNV
jgi:hypothetical protein